MDRNSRKRNSPNVGKNIFSFDEFLAYSYHPRAASRKARFLSLEGSWKEPPELLVPFSFVGSPSSIERAWIYRDLFNGTFCGLYHRQPCVAESAQIRLQQANNPRNRMPV